MIPGRDQANHESMTEPPINVLGQEALIPQSSFILLKSGFIYVQTPADRQLITVYFS